MPPQRATVRVPATSANLGPGFDCLGMALDLWAEVTVEARPEPLPPAAEPLATMIEKAALALYEAGRSRNRRPACRPRGPAARCRWREAWAPAPPLAWAG